MNPTFIKIKLVHKEPEQDCIEILKSAIVEDKVLEKVRNR